MEEENSDQMESRCDGRRSAKEVRSGEVVESRILSSRTEISSSSGKAFGWREEGD